MLIPSEKITNSETLIREMHKKYYKNFNENITFIQLNQEIAEDGKIKHHMSFEAFHYPGRFRNDFGPVPGKDGYIIANDTMYIYEKGVLKSKKYAVDDIMLLTGDIYFMPVEEAISELKKAGYDLTKFREDTWKNKPAYVVGADKGDETKPQFWIDKEELYIVRNINYDLEDGQFEDQHFLEHAKVDKAWVEERVEIYVKGRMIKKEHYAEVKANGKLDLQIFDAKYFGTKHWRNK
ncbi:MAG: hypothetical protein NW207_01400 [Cytophagales bacterium]|nr:hypothetical protein [Cytophagales bacterium]